MAAYDHVTASITLVFESTPTSAYFVYAGVALATYFLLPMMINKISRRPIRGVSLLVAAGLIFFGSLFVPSPLIHGQNTHFLTHFFGGGIFTGLVWLFLKINLNWKLNPLLELLSLYFLVSGLGVANELFELLAN